MEENTLEFQTSEKDGWTIWSVRGRLDRMTSQEAGDEADRVFAAARKLAVEMSGLQYLSGAGIRVPLRLAKQAKAEAKDFVLVAPAGMVKEVLSESRVDMFIRIYAAVDALP